MLLCWVTDIWSVYIISELGGTHCRTNIILSATLMPGYNHRIELLHIITGFINFRVFLALVISLHLLLLTSSVGNYVLMNKSSAVVVIVNVAIQMMTMVGVGLFTSRVCKSLHNSCTTVAHCSFISRCFAEGWKRRQSEWGSSSSAEQALLSLDATDVSHGSNPCAWCNFHTTLFSVSRCVVSLQVV